MLSILPFFACRKCVKRMRTAKSAARSQYQCYSPRPPRPDRWSSGTRALGTRLVFLRLFRSDRSNKVARFYIALELCSSRHSRCQSSFRHGI